MYRQFLSKVCILPLTVGLITLKFGLQPSEAAGLTFESPTYALTAVRRDFEERTYPAAKWVCTRGLTNETMLNHMFMKLYYYYSGANQQGVRIEMTTPIVRQYDDVGNVSMLMFIPQRWQSDPPEPRDEALAILDVPETQYFVKQFGGIVPMSVGQKDLDTLKDTVRSTYTGEYGSDPFSAEDHTHYWIATYSLPYHSYTRTELWIQKNTTSGQNVHEDNVMDESRMEDNATARTDDVQPRNKDNLTVVSQMGETTTSRRLTMAPTHNSSERNGKALEDTTTMPPATQEGTTTEQGPTEIPTTEEVSTPT